MKFGYLSLFIPIYVRMSSPDWSVLPNQYNLQKQHIQEGVVFTIEYIVGSCNSSHQRIFMYINVRIITYLCSNVLALKCTYKLYGCTQATQGFPLYVPTDHSPRESLGQRRRKDGTCSNATSSSWALSWGEICWQNMTKTSQAKPMDFNSYV